LPSRVSPSNAPATQVTVLKESRHSKLSSSESAKMSESKKKGAPAGDAVPAESGSKAMVFLDLLNQMCGIAKKLKEETQGVEDFAELLDRHKKLAVDLQAREDEICRLRVEKEVLWKEFSAQHRASEVELAALRNTEADLKHTQARFQTTENTIQRLKSEHRKLQQQAAQQASVAEKYEGFREASENKIRDLEVRYATVGESYKEFKAFLRQDILETLDTTVM